MELKNTTLSAMFSQQLQVKEKKDERWIVGFLLFEWLIYVIAIYAFSYGQPAALKQPYDPDNLACGVDLGVAGYPFIYFATPSEKYLYRTVCVSTCPLLLHDQTDEDESLILDCAPNSVINTCGNHPSIGYEQFQTLVYNSVPYKSSCLPTQLSLLQAVLQAARQPFIASHFHDFLSGRYVIVLSLLICLFINVLMMRFLHKYTSAVVYSIIALLWVSLVLITVQGIRYATKFTGLEALTNNDPKINLTPEEVVFLAQSQTVSLNSIYVTSGIFGFFAIVVVIIFFFFRSRIRNMIKVLQITSEFLSSIGEDLSYIPIATAIIQTINISVWFGLALYLLSCGSVNQQKHQLPYTQFQINGFSYLLFIVHIVQGFWTTSFISGSQEYIHQSAYTLYYGSKIKKLQEEEKNQQEKKEIKQEDKKEDKKQSQKEIQIEPLPEQEKDYMDKARESYIFKHSGSVIIGQMLIIAVTPIKWIFNLFYHFEQGCVKFCCKNQRCQDCMNDCFQNKVGKICQNAYIFVKKLKSKIINQSYLENASYLESCQSLQNWVINHPNERKEQVTFERQFTFFCQLAIPLGTSCMVFAIVTQYTPISFQVSSPVTFTMLSFLFSYFLTYLFASVYGSCIDTLCLLLRLDSDDTQRGGVVYGANTPQENLRLLIPSGN